MDTLLTIAGIIAGIIAVIVLLALIGPKGYTVVRSIVINKPRQLVYDYVKFLGNQQYYNKWVMLDPNKRTSTTGTDGTVGYNSTWDSDVKQVGKGNQTIEGLVDGERIDIRIVFEKPMPGVADTYIATQSVTEDSTAVKWSMQSKMPFPMNAMLLVINMDKLLGKDLDESLSNLKRELEK